MTQDTTFLGADVVEPDSFLEPRRYRVTYKCARCGHEFKRGYKVVPKDDPPCPREACAVEAKLAESEREAERLRAMIELGIAPAHVGANPQVKAVDFTAETVMQNYGMTDLRDNIREGEVCAPKLAPAQQDAADNYFKGGGQGDKVALDFGTGQARKIPRKQWDLIGRRALAGAYRGMSVNPNVVAPGVAQGSPALRLVKTEKIG